MDWKSGSRKNCNLNNYFLIVKKIFFLINYNINFCFFFVLHLQNIEEILNASAKGKSIIRYYQTNNLLNAECRSKLVQIVGDKLLAVQRKYV